MLLVAELEDTTSRPYSEDDVVREAEAILILAALEGGPEVGHALVRVALDGRPRASRGWADAEVAVASVQDARSTFRPWARSPPRILRCETPRLALSREGKRRVVESR